MLIINKKKTYPKDIISRRGRFNVSKEILNEPNHIVFEFFSNFIIVRAEAMYDTGSIEYIAVSKLFEPVKEGYGTPDYNFEITERDDGSIDIKARKVPNERGKKLLRLLRKLDG